MGARPFCFQKETYYHIYNRGCNKQRLFFSEKDLERFGKIIIRYKEKYKDINIHVWSFLPNHFHFLLSEKSEIETGLDNKKEKAQQISNFMRQIQGAYAMYFKARREQEVSRSPVFDGRFKAKEITDEAYLAQVAYYVRYNAVKHGIVENARDWVWAGVTPTAGTDRDLSLLINDMDVDPEFDPGFE
jgi:putative transposase